MSQNKITLNTLLNFVPENEKERKIFNGINTSVLNEYFDDTKSSWSKGCFYLGGQVPLRIDNEITIDLIKKVRRIDQQQINSYGEPVNSFEMASIYNTNRKLNELEFIIQKVNEIFKLRVLNELDKINLRSDTNKIIISFI